MFPLFIVEDLYGGQGIHRVCTTIERLAMIAHSKGFGVSWERYGRNMEKRLVERETPVDVANIPYDPSTEAEPEPEPEVEVEEFAIEETEDSEETLVEGVASMRKNTETEKNEKAVQLTPLELKIRELMAEVIRAKDGTTLLGLAVCTVDCNDVVEYVLEHPDEFDCGVDQADKKGNTPLHYAARTGNAKATELLLKAHANPNAVNKKRENPAHVAIARENTEVIGMLLDADSNVEAQRKENHDTVLLVGVCEGAEEGCLVLMDKREKLGVNVRRKDGESVLEATIRTEKNEVLRRLLKQFGADPHQCNAKGENALHVACRLGAEEAVKILIEFDSTLLNEKDGQGNTPLHTAVGAGHSDLAKKLVEAGADINAKNNEGNTPIMLAVEVDNDAFIDLMVRDFGTDVNTSSKGSSALYRASWRGNTVIVSLLCKRGANVNQQNLEGWSPLHAASSQGHKEVCELLVDSFGAKVNVTNKQGTTPLYHACEHGHYAVAKFLLEHGADVNLGLKHGWKPIHISVSSAKLTKLLLDTGKVDLKAYISASMDYTALHLAVSIPRPSTQSISYLLDAGASQKACNTNGQTPLHLSVYRGNIDCVRALCEHPTNKPDFNAKNKASRTPLDLACYGALPEIAAYLADKMGIECPKVSDKNKLKLKKAAAPTSVPNPDAYFKKMKKGVDKDTDAEIESIRKREEAEKKAAKEKKAAEKAAAKKKKEEEKKAKKEKKSS